MNLDGMSTEQRRENQREAGLEFLPALELSTVEATRVPTDSRQENEEDLAARGLGKILRKLQRDEGWLGVAKHELKKAAVTVPIFCAAALGVLWVNKRWIAK